MPTRRTLLTAGLASLAAPAWAMPAGAYAHVLSKAYGGPVDPLAAHARARAVAQVVQARADVLLKGQGLSGGSVATRLRTLAADDRWLYRDDETGRDFAVAEMNFHLKALGPRLAEALGGLTVAPAQVQRMPAAEVAAGRRAYRIAPTETAPGVYYVDLRAIRARPSWTLTSAAFHEVTPGHLLQMPLEAAACPPPARVKAAGAYFEAWAIYAEQLAADLGAYRSDPLGEIGYLQWRLFRLGRIVADTGLHALGWSRERAVAEVRELQGFPAAFIGIEADVSRIAATPGEYAAEGLGALSLAAWRPADRRRWPAWHMAVLATGPWPFGELERRLRG